MKQPPHADSGKGGDALRCRRASARQIGTKNSQSGPSSTHQEREKRRVYKPKDLSCFHIDLLANP